MTEEREPAEVLHVENTRLRVQITTIKARLAELEQQLAAERKEHESLRQVLDSMPPFIYVYDFSTQRNAYANHELTELLGYTPQDIESMEGGPAALLMHPDDVAQAFEQRQQRLKAAADGEIITVRYRARHRSGQWRWLEDRAVPFRRMPDGTMQQFIGAVYDITDQRKAEQELRESQSLFRALLDNTPAVMFVKDPQMRLILTNREFDRFFGVDSGALLGKVDHDYFPQDVADALAEEDKQILDGGKAVQIEQVMPHAAGDRAYLTTKFPIYDDKGELLAFGGCAMDISALKQAEAARARLQAEIIEAQQSTIRELVTPLLPLASNVVAMPLVGTIDSTRAQQILETLLDGIASHQAAIAILDITGVKQVNTQVAQALVQAAQAAKLLGAQVVLTGIQPAIAQTLVELGADLTGIVTQATLQGGIAYALHTRPRAMRDTHKKGVAAQT